MSVETFNQNIGSKLLVKMRIPPGTLLCSHCGAKSILGHMQTSEQTNKKTTEGQADKHTYTHMYVPAYRQIERASA